MPKLKTQEIVAQNDAGQRLSFKSEIGVSTHGEFRACIPGHLSDDVEFMSCIATARENRLAEQRGGLATRFDTHRNDTKLETLQKHTYLVSSTLPPLMAVLSQAAELYIKVETTTERVILYHTSSRVKYALSSDGRVAQNGYLAGEGYTWPESVSEFSARDDGSSFTVGLWARAYDKVIHRRGEAVVIEYKDPDDKESLSFEGSALMRLNAFLGTNDSIPDQGTGVNSRHFQGNGYRREFDEVPYSDEAADYFSSLLLSMCELARRMEEFFADKDRLLIAITRSENLLAAPTKD